MKKLALALLLSSAIVAFSSPAHSQSSPGWVQGYIPTAAEWNTQFASKQDVGVPLTYSTLALSGTAVDTFTDQGGAIFGATDYRRVYVLPQVGDAGSTGSRVIQWQRVGSKNSGEDYVTQASWVQTSTTPQSTVMHGHRFTVSQGVGVDPGETWALFAGIGTSATTASVNSVAFYAQALRNNIPAAGVGVPIMGAVIEAQDLTGASSATGGQQRSLELDLLSSGADDYTPANNGRAFMTLLMGRSGQAIGAPIGSAQTISHVLRITDLDSGAGTIRQGFSGSSLHISRSFFETTEMTQDASAHMIWLGTGHHLALNTAGTSYIYSSGNTILITPSVTGNVVIGYNAALATNATAGFMQIPAMAGTPTGATGSAAVPAMVWNSTANRLCVSEGGGTWVNVDGGGAC